jgi:hypothetical protein
MRLSDVGAPAVQGSAAEDGRLRPPAGRRLNVVQKVLTSRCLEHPPSSHPVGWCVLGHP